MSKIKIQGHSSGNGLVTITGPNTDSTRTLTIPDITGTVITSGDSGTVTQDIVHPDAVNKFISGRKNLIINGGMDVWQRAISSTGSVTVADYFTVDRFWTYNTSSNTITQSTDVPSGEGFIYSLNFSTSIGAFGQPIELPAQGKTMLKANTDYTFSFWAKVGSAADLNTYFRYRDIKAQVAGTVTISDNVVSITTSWTRHSVTVNTGSVVPASTNNILDLEFASSNLTNLKITGIQLEIGDTATDFDHRSYGEELALCQRYYFDSRAGTNPADSRYMGMQMSGMNTDDRVAGGHSFPVQMRDIPDTFLFSPSGTAGKVAVYNINQTDVGSGFELQRVSKMGWAYVGDSPGLSANLRYIYEVIADAEL